VTNVLLVGAGRMGLRHLSGVAKEADEITVVYHHQKVDDVVQQVLEDSGFEGKANVVPSIETAATHGAKFDAAILTATAEIRAERFGKVISLEIPHILIEKPLEQSRENVLRMHALGKTVRSDIRCNHPYREQSIFADFRRSDSAVHITVNAGAIGLACGGIHWIDLALFLSGSATGRFVFGMLDRTPIGSGRGRQFQDFGGCGFFEFDNGSSLFLQVDANSSAPVVCVVTQEHRQLVIDYLNGGASVHQRAGTVDSPNYLYGKGYVSRKDSDFTNIDLSAQTGLWLQHVKGMRASQLPTLDEAVQGHELLFDLLETGGANQFPIT